MVEVSDEKGIVKDLRRNPYAYGTDYLKERETLVLLKVEGMNKVLKSFVCPILIKVEIVNKS